MISVNSAKKKCKDNISLIENYEEAVNDKTNLWECHHRLELTLDGEFANSEDDLKRMGMYFKRPYFELIFLEIHEHRDLHNLANKKVKKHTNESKDKISKSLKGNNNRKGIPTSEFGIKFKDHYGITVYQNPKLYQTEKNWYYRHNNKCRWE